jgi:hypothetical protein
MRRCAFCPQASMERELTFRFDYEPVYEFPAGFRMLAGDPNRRTLDTSDPAQAAVGYTCLGGNTTRRHGMAMFDQLELTRQNFQPSTAPKACVPSSTFQIAGTTLTYTTT